MTINTLKLFYNIKPFLPRRLQIAFRRIRAQRIFRKMPPPYLHSTYLNSNVNSNSLPNNAECVVLLTHDIETVQGLINIKLIREVEREYGVISNWNFVLEKYGDVSDYIKELNDEGCECGAHGLYHDGLLFKDKNTYDERMKKIVEIAFKLNLHGFRTPAMHRNEDWMRDLPFKWDSSFPAWDPFQPQAGGCERYYPYRLNEKTWELPVTLFQDFTIFFELEQKSIDIWKAQASALAKRRMLINAIVHPDYMNEKILTLYKQFIRYFKENLNLWITTPSELCDWLDKNQE